MKHSIKNWTKAALMSGVCAVMLMSAPSVQAQDAFTADQKKELQAMFEEFLKNNGEMVLQAVDNYRAEEERRSELSAMEKLKEYKDFYTDASLPMAGNPKGDITIVEYFDYNCGYCRQALLDLQKIIEEDKNVRVVFQEMPILRPTSKEMALMAAAAHKQGKYFETHTALMEYTGPKNQDAYKKIAKDVGLDWDQLAKDMESQELADHIGTSMGMARDMGIRGTPGFIIGDEIIPGYVDIAGLRSIIAEQREKQTAE